MGAYGREISKVISGESHWGNDASHPLQVRGRIWCKMDECEESRSLKSQQRNKLRIGWKHLGAQEYLSQSLDLLWDTDLLPCRRAPATCLCLHTSFILKKTNVAKRPQACRTLSPSKAASPSYVLPLSLLTAWGSAGKHNNIFSCEKANVFGLACLQNLKLPSNHNGSCKTLWRVTFLRLLGNIDVQWQMLWQSFSLSLGHAVWWAQAKQWLLWRVLKLKPGLMEKIQAWILISLVFGSRHSSVVKYNTWIWKKVWMVSILMFWLSPILFPLYTKSGARNFSEAEKDALKLKVCVFKVEECGPLEKEKKEEFTVRQLKNAFWRVDPKN